MKLNSSYLKWLRQDNGKKDCLEVDDDDNDDNCDLSNDNARDPMGREEGRDEEQNILDLPEDIILLFFQYLPPKDLISLESSSSLLRGLIIHYCVYKARLDKIFRLKRQENYMLLSEAASGEKTVQEMSGYYKSRLYQHTCRNSNTEFLDFILFMFCIRRQDC
eukprot:GFUD01119360.1.p1 GENE.GFUD01119360.1~~GFUD01119360.1.p1  ORF type:complete len:163 (+),score=51.12 GFUD01119360.1:42-530(+)